MKKSITVAALLAAGTGFANAEQITFNTTSWASETNAVNITNPTTLSSGSIEGLEKWEISFDWSYAKGMSSNQWGTTVIATGTDPFSSGGYAGGFQIRWNNGTASGKTDGLMFVVANGRDNHNSLTLGTFTDFATADRDFNFTISYDIDSKALSFIVKSGETTLKETLTSTSEVSFSTLSTGSSSYATVGSYSNLSGSYAIPEPSAFGMLAGLGALALVASRRRRK